MEWHKRMEEARLQELRKGRELVVQKEEISYLKKLVEEQDRTVRLLEEDIVQLNSVRTNLLQVHNSSQTLSKENYFL